MMAHAKAPWQTHGSHFYDADQNLLGQVHGDPVMDNLRLVHKAPELLDRLEQLVIGIGMGWDLDGLVDAANTVIAEARGE